MRGLACITLASALALSAGAQTMTEFGAAAAAGSVGGAAGKKVSDGLTAVFGKVDQQTKAAAKEDPAKTEKPVTPPSATTSVASAPAPAPSPAPAAAPAPKPAPAKKAVSTAKRVEPASVPDPPAPPSHAAVVNKAPEPAPQPPPTVEIAPVVPPPPPPPEVTAENLRSIAPGATREDLLKLGAPASRMTMFGDEGHLLEIYSYVTKGVTFGVVRLSDGAVAKVEIR